MQGLRDIKPNWTEGQVYDSAKKHFGKSFTLFNPEFDEPVESNILPNVEVTEENYTVKEINELIRQYGFDIDLKLNKADKIEAINKLLG